ncbi:MAG: hypothetical protein KDD04_11655, partial [Sinomicrobium sp.]|nr:hypothetical protein [Sinomicrobium sp.]
FFDQAEITPDDPQEDTPPNVTTATAPDIREKPAQQHPKPGNGLEKRLTDHPILDTHDAWRMTPLEYQQMKAIEKTGSPMALDKRDSDNHEAIVKQAIGDKMAVPKHVLAHYPWLIEKAPKESASKQPEKGVKASALKKFGSFISRYRVIDGHLYDGQLKTTYGELGKAALKQLAEYLGLAAYNVNFNKAGVGVSGDLSLMGMFTPDKGIYISLSKDGLNDGVLYRSIRHMKDYTGGSNNYFPESELTTPEIIKEKVYRLLGIEKAEGDKAPAKAKYDYLDRVIGHLHEKYANGERPTKGQIEKLGQDLGVP